MPPFAPPPQHPDLAAALAGLPPERFSATFHAAVEVVERYGRDWAIALADTLGLLAELDEARSVPELAARRGFVPSFLPALDWILRSLEADALVARREGSLPTYRRTGGGRPPALAELRAQGLEIEPLLAPTLALLDDAGAAYPALARGEIRGEHALFGAGQVAHWCDYFSNRNPVYGVNNLIAAAAVLPRLPAGRFSILELGAGAGSGSEELLLRLEESGRLADLERYAITEPSTFFRRRGERLLRARFPGAPLEFAALDLNEPAGSGPLAGEQFDVVYAVNVLHVARDLAPALAAIRSRLAPGGWLVAGECLRLSPGQPLAAEMIFLALDSFVQVHLDPKRRPNPGFLLPEQWLRLLTEAGLERVEVFPDLLRIRSLYDHFNAGALCGRQPT